MCKRREHRLGQSTEGELFYMGRSTEGELFYMGNFAAQGQRCHGAGRFQVDSKRPHVTARTNEPGKQRGLLGSFYTETPESFRIVLTPQV